MLCNFQHLFPIFRWLLLDFKREFPFGEALRLFEVISSHYLELNSDKALVETDKVIAKEFEHDSKWNPIDCHDYREITAIYM